MYSADNIEALAFIGLPYVFENICLIYPLSISSILSLQERYERDLQLLTINRSFIIRLFNKKEISVDTIPTPFDFLIGSAKEDNRVLLEISNAFATFIREKITILFDTKQIIVGDPLEHRIINDSNFTAFQNVIRLQNRLQKEEEIPENEDPRMRKFREKRELRDAIKRKQESAKAPSFATLMNALCAFGVGITPLNIGELSLYSFYSQLQINGHKERYNAEMHFLYGGADPKKLKPEYWITNNN